MSLIAGNKTYTAYADKWMSMAFHVSTMMMFIASSIECSTILRTHLEEEAFHDMPLHLGNDVEWTGMHRLMAFCINNKITQ